MAANVTIARTDFEALLRRAEFHVPHRDLEDKTTVTDPTIVRLSSKEHERLVHDARAFHTLCNALLKGGISQETLDLLVSSPEADNLTQDIKEEGETYPGQHQPRSGGFDQRSIPPVGISGPTFGASNDEIYHSFGRGTSDNRHPSAIRHSSSGAYSSLSVNDKDDFTTVGSQAPRPFPHANEQRTILLTNLSDRTTHKDITSIVRGGRLLDIFIRQDRSAIVSFVEGAQDFFTYVKRNDLYLHAKRIDVRWHDRQFHIANHIANKIAHGATRNIVIRGVEERLSEQQIRDDLEHIHNLVVIEVKLQAGDIYISTNSLHNALFARTCMMSRSAYKGLKIEWFPDECAAAIPKVHASRFKDHASQVQPKATPAASLSNRFNLLNLDESETGSDEDDDDTSRPVFPSYGVDLNWADRGIIAS